MPNFTGAEYVPGMRRTMLEDIQAERAAPSRVGDASPSIAAALESGIAALSAWCEIADEEDQRTDDYAALAAMRDALAMVQAGPVAVPLMVAVLEEALAYQRAQFDGHPDHDLSVSGADCVDWFAQWRERARDILQANPAIVAPHDPKTPEDFARYVATMPKHGEPEPGDPQYTQTWEEEGGQYAIEALHGLIDRARAIPGL